MNKLISILFLLLAILLNSCTEKESASAIYQTNSPENKVKVKFFLKEGNIPAYQVFYQDRIVVDTSALGFEIAGMESLSKNLQVVDTATSIFDETWEQPWGEVKKIRNNYEELKISLQEKDGKKRKLNVVFRVFDYGIGFRYEFPEQENLKSFEITNELTEFKMAGNHRAWWIPAYQPIRFEYITKENAISELDTVHTPLTMKTDDGLYISIHEAALSDYSSMTIFSAGNQVLGCDLVPWKSGVKVKTSAPMLTPWRTIQIAENPGDLITSYLILNLNAPNQLGDVSWVKPGKYIGIWWEMHVGVGSWESGSLHAATTENTKMYIDFAAKYGFDGVLVEGWNVGWDSEWVGDGKEFSFSQPYPDFNVSEITKYAKEKGVYIVGHHETGAAVENYEAQLEDAFTFLEENGMKAVKTGYVGDKLSNGEWHHGQFVVDHHRRVLETAAKHQVMLVAHEPIKPTGNRRTFPNMISREGARGQEFNAWAEDGGNPPSHTTIIPFTRLLAGPMDFTPGVFDIEIKTKPYNQVNTTISKQLALYVIIYSPMQMACDLPQNYERHPAFQFILDVATDWEDTKVLDAAIGDYVTIARQQRDSDNWFVGSITDENSRNIEIKFDFLDPEKTYKATIYRDAENAHYKDNPTAYQIEEMELTANSKLFLPLAPGGGTAISIKPI